MFELKKFLLLGLAVFSSKIALLFIAYFFDADTYNIFNQAYYTSSLLILFGALGFNIAVTRIKIRHGLIYISVFVNLILTYLFLYFISEAFADPAYIASVFIYSFFSVLGGIFTFQLLFEGKYKDYVYLTLLYSVLHLAIIPVVLFLKVNVVFTLPFVTALWFFIGYPKFIRQSEEGRSVWKEFYKVGLSAFIINSAVSLALSLDKYYVNSFFELSLANSYTFSWSLTAPVFYIGSIIERYLYSGKYEIKHSLFRKGFGLSVIFIPLYTAALICFVYFLPQFLPSSVDVVHVREITTLMIAGYSIYSLIHFTVNAYLFKLMHTSVQKEVSVYYTVILMLFLGYFYFVFQDMILLNYKTLLISIWTYIFLLLTAKIVLLLRRKKETFGSENI